MNTWYVPTCSLASDAFFALQERVRVNCTLDYNLALVRSREIAREHGGDPVVLSFPNVFGEIAGSQFFRLAVDPAVAEVHCREELRTPRARLGLQETAFLAELVDGLQTALKTAEDVVRFGAGEGTVNVNEMVPQSFKDKLAKNKAERERKAKNAAIKKRVGNAKKKAGVKPAQPAKPAKPAKGAKPAKKATQPKKPTPATTGGKPVRPPKTSANKGQKVASRTVHLQGTVNGQPAKATLRKGSKYTVVKAPSGLVLTRRGQKPFVVNPADAGKVH